MTGIITFSSKLPAAPAKATAASLPITWAQIWQTTSGSDRVDLARHDRRARLQVRDVDLGQPGPRARSHQPQVVADLVQADRDRAQHSARGDQSVARSGRLEMIAGLGERQSVALRAARRSPGAAKSAGAFSPVPTAVPPSGSSQTSGSAASMRSMPCRTAAA